MIDVLYLAWNRLAFTEKTFETLLVNTSWEHVRRLVIHDDGSEDGTSEYLHEAHTRAPVPCDFTIDPLRSPPAVMNRMVERTEAEWFFKCDSDICLGPGWLPKMLGVLERNPELELLGCEPGRMGRPRDDWDGVYRAEPCSHIGGVGLMRTESFLRHRSLPEESGRFGWTEHQHEFEPVRAWINPDIEVFSLDQLPFEPWQSLSAEYVEAGWQRFWPPFHHKSTNIWDWAFPLEPVESGDAR